MKKNIKIVSYIIMEFLIIISLIIIIVVSLKTKTDIKDSIFILFIAQIYVIVITFVKPRSDNKKD
ncbi:MAG: hypothetical protein ACOWWH_13915 [Eubacteriaceae bacterium]